MPGLYFAEHALKHHYYYNIVHFHVFGSGNFSGTSMRCPRNRHFGDRRSSLDNLHELEIRYDSKLFRPNQYALNAIRVRLNLFLRSNYPPLCAQAERKPSGPLFKCDSFLLFLRSYLLEMLERETVAAKLNETCVNESIQFSNYFVSLLSIALHCHLITQRFLCCRKRGKLTTSLSIIFNSN